jgi:hypothetical protein
LCAVNWREKTNLPSIRKLVWDEVAVNTIGELNRRRQVHDDQERETEERTKRERTKLKGYEIG